MAYSLSVYLLVGLLFFVFFCSSWLVSILRFLFHVLLYGILSLSKLMDKRSKEFWIYLSNLNSKKAVSTKLAAASQRNEEEAIKIFQDSFILSIVGTLILPATLIVSLWIKIGVLQYVIDNTSNVNSTDSSNSSNSFGFLLNPTVISSIQVIQPILIILLVCCIIYFVACIFHIITFEILDSQWIESLIKCLPTAVNRCIHVGVRASHKNVPSHHKNSNIKNDSNHPALNRMHRAKHHQDVQQQNFIAFINSVIQLISFVVLALMILTGAGIDMTPIWGVLAIGGIAITVGSDLIVRNLCGTATVFYSDTHRVGDIITIEPSTQGVSESLEGQVSEITPFFTKIIGYDGNLHTIPNKIFTDQVTHVWRADSMKYWSQTFIFDKSITRLQLDQFKSYFTHLKSQYPQISNEESYVWQQLVNASTVRIQVVLCASMEDVYNRGPKFLAALSQASQARSECDPIITNMRLVTNEDENNNSTGLDEKKAELHIPVNHSADNSSTETADKPFIFVAQDFMVKLHDYCVSTHLPRVETMLYT